MSIKALQLISLSHRWQCQSWIWS